MEQKKYLDLDGLKHYNDKLKTLIDNSTANNVIVKGNVDNSAILKGEYRGYKNIALSQTSAAIGAAVKAGLKGWYYNHVNVGEKKIFLTSKQSTTISNTSLIYPDKNFINDTFECGYSVGDTISIVFNKKYENYATITSISGNVITLSEIPFTTDDFTLGTAKVVATTPDEFSFYSVKREVNSTTNEVTVTNYDKGDVDLGGGAHAEGANSTAANIAAHAEGIQTLADGQAAHAEGIMTQAVYAAHAEGFKTVASGHNSHAEGNQTVASGQDAHAEGKEAVASGIQSHAEGQWTQAQGSQSHAEGENSVAKGNQSHAEGYSTLSEGVNSHSEGESTQALGKDSHAEGFQTVAKGTYTHAEGYNAVAYGNYSHAEGFSSLKLEDIDAKSGETYEEKWDSLENVEKFNMAFGKQSHVEGNGNIAVGDRGHAEGIFTKALGTNSHAEGQQTISEGIASHAEGFNTHAKGKGSHTSGIGTITNNDGEFACGQYNDSIVDQTIFSIGIGTNIGNIIERSNIFEITKDKILFKGENINVIKKYNDSGIILIDTNNTNIATGVDSFAMGRGSTSSAPYAVSMGTGSIAAGNYSFAGGTGSETTGSGSFAFGGQCKALQNRAVAMGYQCESNGFQSFAMGRGIKTTNNDEFSCGKYNYSDPSKNTLFSVGHGTSDTRRRNLIEVNNTDDGFGKVIIQSQNESPSTDGDCSIEVERNGVKISVVDGDGEYGSDRSSIVVNSDSIKLKQSSPGDYIKNNILELNSSGLYYNDENILHNITPILYEELKNLRDNSELIPGRWYRITDYQCYTSQENTRSANHPFDILVMALSENILSEDARAMMRDGDTYYEHANITAWKLKYVLDDPEQKYYWGIIPGSASEEEIQLYRGVIYEMIDNHGNECPYDFKNIQYLLDDGYWYFTFDASMIDDLDSGPIRYEYDASLNDLCGYNIIKPVIPTFINNSSNRLNMIIFKGSNSAYNTFGEGCYANIFEDNCQLNTFRGACYSNTFGNECSNNTFGVNCSENTFGNRCSSNTFGNYCSENTFGNECCSNTFKNNETDNLESPSYSSKNTFRNRCSSNTFGENFRSNTFRDYCSNNTFRDYCSNNTFRDYCHSNTFGENFRSNTFGGVCFSSTFGDDCYYLDFTALHHIYRSKFSSNTQNINFDVGENVSGTGMQNIFVGPGIYGKSNNRLAIDIEVYNNNYEWRIMKNSKGEIKQYCEADLIF